MSQVACEVIDDSWMFASIRTPASSCHQYLCPSLVLQIPGFLAPTSCWEVSEGLGTKSSAPGQGTPIPQDDVYAMSHLGERGLGSVSPSRGHANYLVTRIQHPYWAIYITWACPVDRPRVQDAFIPNGVSKSMTYPG